MKDLILHMNKEVKNLVDQGEGYNLEFKESLNDSISKDICAFANTGGGIILLGVTDSREIKGLKLTNSLKSRIQNYATNMNPSLILDINDKDNIIIIRVPEGEDKPYSINGKFYQRQGANSQQLTRNEIKDLFKQEGFLRFDEIPSKDFEFDNDFDKHKFRTFLQKANISSVIKSEKILENLQLIEKGHLKNAGVLFFCHKVTKFFISATITCVLYRGNDKYKVLDRKEFDADLYSNYQNAILYLENNLRTEYIIKGTGPRREKLELPEEALREAVLNAIAHRDYFSTSNIQINIFKDRVEITNPGGLIGNITVKDLFERSIPRNHLLFGLMQRLELVEKAGSGLVRIQRAMKEYKLSSAEIKADKNWFSIAFKRPDLE